MIEPGCLINLETLMLVIIAYLGAVFANFIRYASSKTLPDERRPDIDGFYWKAFFVVFPLMGVFLILCYLLEGTPITPFLALHIGITAPLTIGALAGISVSSYEI